MLRSKFVASALGVLLLVVPTLSRAGDSSAPPSQALVRINASGQLEVLGRVGKQVTEERQATKNVKIVETQQRIQKEKVVKDGVEQQVDVPVTVQVERMVPQTYTYTTTRMVYETSITAFPASTNGFRRDADKVEIPLYDLAGNRLSVTAVEDRLHDWTLVLISNTGKPLDRKFASLFKPTTIVSGVPPMTAMAPMPMPTPGYAPAPQPVVPSGVPAPAAGLIEPSNLSPVAFFADDAMPQLPNSPEPTFAFAKVWGEKTLALRTENEKTISMCYPVTKYVEKTMDGKQIKVPITETCQLEKVIEIRETVRHPLADVSVTRMPNKELTKSELPSALAAEVLAVVSADGKPVDQLWLRNLRDGAFVIVAPGGSGGGPAPMPVTMPPPYAPPPGGVVAPKSEVIPLPPPSPTVNPST